MPECAESARDESADSKRNCQTNPSRWRRQQGRHQRSVLPSRGCTSIVDRAPRISGAGDFYPNLGALQSNPSRRIGCDFQRFDFAPMHIGNRRVDTTKHPAIESFILDAHMALRNACVEKYDVNFLGTSDEKVLFGQQEAGPLMETT
ncbi:hypothetical protein WT37_04385 [Burkholderia territorii]|nr:hypothetical protein WT37_04385 [Burkholderia territorii]